MVETFEKLNINTRYEVGANGTIKLDGKITKADKFYINGKFIQRDELLNSNTPKEVKIKPIAKPKPSGWIHGNTGKKHSLEAIQRIKDSKLKPVVINEVVYKSQMDYQLPRDYAAEKPTIIKHRPRKLERIEVLEAETALGNKTAHNELTQLTRPIPRTVVAKSNPRRR